MKKVIVTGATGSFGNTIVRSLIESDEIEQVMRKGDWKSVQAGLRYVMAK